MSGVVLVTLGDVERAGRGEAASACYSGDEIAAMVATLSIVTGKTKPMIKMIITIRRRMGMSHEDFVRYQRDVHGPLLMAIAEAR